MDTTETLKVKFLTVIWGARYIEEFANVSLPSYLAPGNLPSLAGETDLEVLIMTSADSRDKFEEQPLVGRLKSYCRVRYILIDDLITTGNYGVTLTLAYARGIRDSGAEQVNTNFVFMNSDFVLADGSLRTLIGKLRDGHAAIMAPSLRARSEMVLPILSEYVTEDRTLSIAPRDLVQIAFDHLHPTVIGKTITQNFINCTTHNQIYWQVDDQTMLGRYHLIFMLAIRPEVPMTPINSYCDYGFVTELVPSGNFTLMDDSDDFFMLELSASAQEKEFLRCGSASADQIASELSRWTTREHRRFAEIDVVFRTGEVPARLALVRAEAAKFVAAINAKIGEPLDHAEHFYWTSGIQAWSSLKFRGMRPVWPPEIAPLPGYDHLPVDVTGLEPYGPFRPEMYGPFLESYGPHLPPAMANGQPFGKPIRNWQTLTLRDILRGVKRRLLDSYIGLLGVMRNKVGAMPNVPIWHHLWLDSRLLLTWARTARQRNAPVLMICDDSSPLPISLTKHVCLDVGVCLHEVMTAEDGAPVECEALSHAVAGTYDNALIHITRAKVLKLGKVLDWCDRFVKPGGQIAVFVEHRLSETDPSNFSVELAQYIENLLPADWIGYRMSADFAGGGIKRRLRLAERRAISNLWPSSRNRLPLLVAALAIWPIIAALTAFNNYRMRNTSALCPDFASSVMLRLTKPSMTFSSAAARRAARVGDAPGLHIVSGASPNGEPIPIAARGMAAMASDRQEPSVQRMS